MSVLTRVNNISKSQWNKQIVPGLSHRVVPFRLHVPHDQAQGEVVLSQVPPHVQEEKVIPLNMIQILVTIFI